MEMEDRRGEMLAEAEAKDTPIGMRRIVEIIFLPQLELIDAKGDHSYAAFLSEYLMRYRGERFGDFGAKLPTHLDRALQLLRKAMLSLDETTAQRRLITACFMFLNILVSHTRRVVDEAEEGLTEAVEDTITQIVAALEVPPLET